MCYVHEMHKLSILLRGCVCPSACFMSKTIYWISVKFDVGVLHYELLGELKFGPWWSYFSYNKFVTT